MAFVLLIPLLLVPALLTRRTRYARARRFAIAAAALALLPLPLNLLVCGFSSSPGCSGAPGGLALVLVLPIAAGLVLGMLWRAWRALGRTDLRQLAGWQAPGAVLKSVYGTALALWALSSALGFVRLLRDPGPVAPPVLLVEIAVTAPLQVAPMLFAALRLWHLWTDRDALWLPPDGRRFVSVASVLALLAMLAPFVPYRVDGLVLAAVLPLVVFAAVAGVELARYGALERQGS